MRFKRIVSRIPFLLRRHVLRVLKNNEKISFQSISEELGCDQRKIIEITRLAIEEELVSGIITFDDGGFISEKALRYGPLGKDLNLTELVAEISKIARPKIRNLGSKISADEALVLSSVIPRAHEIKSMKTGKILFASIAEVTQKKENVRIPNARAGANLLARARKTHDKELGVLLNSLLPPIRDVGLFNLIKMKTWKLVFSIEWILGVLQSPEPVLLFLDENDSDFGSYLTEVLKTSQDYLPYYANYVHLKRRQKTLAQTLLSLLFLESKNLRTGKTLAEDVVRILKENPQIWIQEKGYYREYESQALLLHVVFSALTHGTAKQRAASIDFLKCMKCYPGKVRFDGWKVNRDLKKQRDTAKFFSHILAYFHSSGQLKRNGRQQKFAACVGDIPIQDIELDDLTESGLPELFEQISPNLSKQKVKFFLASKGNVMEVLSNLPVGLELPSDVFRIVRVPIIEETRVENIVLRVVKDLIALGTLLSSLISYNISEEILKEFSTVLIGQNKGKVSVMDISQDLLALFGVALQKYPRSLTSDDVYSLFEIVRRPVSITCTRSTEPSLRQREWDKERMKSKTAGEQTLDKRARRWESTQSSGRLQLTDRSVLLISLLKCVHAEISERIPFDLFCELLVRYEFVKYKLLWEHDYSLMVDKGGNPEFSVKRKNRDRMLRRVADLIYEKLDPPIPRKLWKNTDAPIYERDIPALLLRQTSHNLFKVTMDNLLSRIDPNWKEILRTRDGY